MQLCTLLRVIRNMIVHIQKIENKELRKIYGGSSDGVMQYYNKRFPKLLAYTYRAWEEVRDQLPSWLATQQRNKFSFCGGVEDYHWMICLI